MEPALKAFLPSLPGLRKARRLQDVEGRGEGAFLRRLGRDADQATELTAWALKRDRRFLKGASACEVGCGTGLLAVLALRLGASGVLGIDCDPAVLKRARRGDARVVWRQGDLLSGVRERFDILVANLPQKPVPVGYRLPLGQHGGRKGDALLRRFMPQAVRHLNPGGRLYLFLHTLAPAGVLARLQKDFRVEVAFWRRRHVPPGEYPPALVDHWMRLAARGKALIHPGVGRPGWHTFYAMQLTATVLPRSGCA